MTYATPDSLRLSWTVSEGQFDHFLVQYKNGDGQPKVVRVPGHEDGVTISGLEPDHKYKMNLYGFHDGQRQGPVSAIGVTGERTVEAPGWEPTGGSHSPCWASRVQGPFCWRLNHGVLCASPLGFPDPQWVSLGREGPP